MFKNYFKIAIAVLRRRKFFTFISLFGISLTLTIVIVLASFIDHLVSAGYPDTQRDRELYVNSLRLMSSKQGYSNTGPASFYFLNTYVSKLKTPERMAIGSIYVATNTYVNNKKLVINLKYTNDEYWNVLSYYFLEGKAFNNTQLVNGEKVAVISEETRDNYFGKGVSAAGKYLETDNVQYRVIGVVKNVPVTRVFAYGDIYVPYTLSKSDLNNKQLTGMYTAILQAKDKDDLPKIREEYNQMISRMPKTDKEFDLIYSYADTYLESFTRMMPFSSPGNSGITIFYAIIAIFFLLFLLLPTLNLVNINISRIMERSSEIGVRKAFGASSKTLVYQFITENLILTFIGCLVGIVLSFLIIQVINNSDLISHADLKINLNVLFYSLLATLIFGLLSGVYPAWRMSRMQVVHALKAQ
ncbi:MAG: ABC transporter permease [Ferruginibacter sp.]|nr:ABC transporter permease [Ferruginibacter sp.]